MCVSPVGAHSAPRVRDPSLVVKQSMVFFLLSYAAVGASVGHARGASAREKFANNMVAGAASRYAQVFLFESALAQEKDNNQ